MVFVVHSSCPYYTSLSQHELHFLYAVLTVFPSRNYTKGKGRSLQDVKLLLLRGEHRSALVTDNRKNTVLSSICLGKLKLT